MREASFFGCNKIADTTVAKYNHLTQTIHLDSVTADQVVRFDKALKDPTNFDYQIFQGIEEIVRPLVHELRHWTDMNCSIKGIMTISKIFELQKSLRMDMPYVWQLKKDLSLGMFIEKGEYLKQPWTHSFSISRPLHHDFDEHLSVCFHHPSDETKIHFKTPIYLGSILECCAVFQELRDVVPMLTNTEIWPLEKHSLKKKTIDFVYNPDFPEYHAIAHAYASASQITDVAEAYELAASICFLLLHMPNDMLRESIDSAVYLTRKQGHLLPPTSLASSWPREFLLLYAMQKIRFLARRNELDLSSDFIFDLLPTWKKSKSHFFARSHEEYCKIACSAKNCGVAYFEMALPALIENNEKMLGKRELTPTILDLKRPPMFCGDFIVQGASEFNGLEDHFYDVPELEMTKILEIQRNPIGLYP